MFKISKKLININNKRSVYALRGIGDRDNKFVWQNTNQKYFSFWKIFQSKFKLSKNFVKDMNNLYVTFIEDLASNKENSSILSNRLFNKIKDTNVKGSNSYNQGQYKVVKYDNLKNDFILDYIYVFYRDTDNKFSKKRKIKKFPTRKVNYIYSKKDQIVDTVRLSIFIKSSSHLLVENDDSKELVNQLKIYDDEWHHMLIEFEANPGYEYHYMDIFPVNSFLKIVQKLIFFGNINNTTKIDLKLIDFDYFLNVDPNIENTE